jgi:hypothetical protein
MKNMKEIKAEECINSDGTISVLKTYTKKYGKINEHASVKYVETTKMPNAAKTKIAEEKRVSNKIAKVLLRKTVEAIDSLCENCNEDQIVRFRSYADGQKVSKKIYSDIGDAIDDISAHDGDFDIEECKTEITDAINYGTEYPVGSGVTWDYLVTDKGVK